MKTNKADAFQEDAHGALAKIIPLEGQAKSLSDAEEKQLRQCEEVLREGLETFFEVGGALLTIRDNHLYRVTHRTFENYCRERWGIGRSYASRVIGAAERVSLLPADGPVPRPSNEFQIRPFLKLQPRDFPKAWSESISRARGGKVTPQVAASVIGELCPSKKRRESRAKGRLKGADAKLPLGKLLAVLQRAKRHIEKTELTEAAAALEDLETILFGGK
jgi:hypothetical protein